MSFHAKDNWFFERLDDGAVRIRKNLNGEQGPFYEVILDASVWASIVASMSPLGESRRTWLAALSIQEAGIKPPTFEVREWITVQDAIRVLNSALLSDPQAVSALLAQRVACNAELGEHPSIQVGWFPNDGSPVKPGSPNDDDGQSTRRVGFLGLLNGLFGIESDGSGPIVIITDEETGEVLAFCRSECSKEEAAQAVAEIEATRIAIEEESSEPVT